MNDKMKLLEERVGKVLDKMEGLKEDNISLKSENQSLKDELTGLQETFRQFRLEHNDQAEQVKSKLATLLGRIEELERIGL